MGIDNSAARRIFLKLGGYGLLGLLTAQAVHKFDEFWGKEGPLISGDVIDTDNIASEIPPSLKNKDIPKRNEYFRDFDQIFKEGLLTYKKWQADNSNLGNLHYETPKNYFDVPNISGKVLPKVDKIPELMGQPDWAVAWGLGALGQIDLPYAMITEASAGGITGIIQMVGGDPGTGFVNNLRKITKEKFGEDYDIWTRCRSGVLEQNEIEVVEKVFRIWYEDAKSYISQETQGGKNPASTSLLFAYFLFRNNGNILQSIWDVTSWLKITSRNDVDTLKFNPNNAKAKLVCSLFKDEFSEKISANWVAENVDPQDSVLNDVGPYQYNQYKDYMPPNRAGFYHPWNIIGLSFHMSPFILRRVVAPHLSQEHGKNDKGEVLVEYGKERTVADWNVTLTAPRIGRIVEEFRVSG